MRVLGKISGAGQVTYAERPALNAQYEITVSEDRGMKRGVGQIRTDIGAIMEMMQANKVMLTLEGGGQVEIVVRQFGSSSNWADIAVSGSIPGY